MAHNVVRLIVPVLLGALILLFPAQGLRALGLGEARVDSWLGQTLDVSIRLLDIESAAIESISVGPASLTDYERLGLPSESLALGLEVTVDRRVDPPRVRVRSQQPVNDPVVQILIDARWASGRVLREYTLFLDPPTVESAAPARRVSDAAPASTSSEPAPVIERAAESVPQRPIRPATPAPRQPAEPEPAASSEPATPARLADAVQVSQGDTLWSIAHAWRPEQSMSMDQVMLAIFNRNRNAFLDGNINRMRSDVRLDMPGLEEVRALNRTEAEQRIREHMRSWQPTAAQAVPVVSDAAMPEREVPGPVESAAETADSAATTQAAEERAAVPAAGQAGEETVHRLDVVPPEDELFSDGSAVAEEEIDRVSDSLAEVEREIVEQGFDDTALDEHVEEVREALAQRDIAGLAVAQESLAELQERLREARLARAEQEETAVQGDESDVIADYMRQLEGEFGAAEAGDDPALEGASESAGQAGDAAFDNDEEAVVAAGEAAVADELVEEAVPPPMAVTRTDSGGLSAWLWPLIGLLILIILIVGIMRWLRGRSAGQPASGLSGGDDALDAARSAVARNPEDLGARLVLLRLLADHGDEQEFTDAFDQMYQEVDDETAPQWQDALSLAALHAPDHPLLQPNETGYGEDQDFVRRADEMLGMLDVDEEPDEHDEPDYTTDDAASFDPLIEPDLELESPDNDEVETELDTDLAVLSQRVDAPSSEPIGEVGIADDGSDDDDIRFDAFQEAEEQASGLSDDSEAGDDDAGRGEFELESTPASIDESEEEDVFGVVESDRSETPEAGLDFSSELSPGPDGEQDGLSDGLDFLPGDASDPVDEPPVDFAESDSAEPPVLNDEDADVKLDLARAYISVDLADSARAVLEEVLSDGSQAKRGEAQQLLDDLD